MEKKSKYGETAKVQQWSSRLIENFEKETGKTVKEWAEIALTCPYKNDRERLNWLKENFGIGQSRGYSVLCEAFPDEYPFFDDHEKSVNELFSGKFEYLRPLYEYVSDEILALNPKVVASPRQTYVPFVAKKQFAVLLPHKHGLCLGLAVGDTLQTTERLQLAQRFPAGRVTRYVILNPTRRL